MKTRTLLFLFALAAALVGCAPKGALQVAEQGSFAVGGTVVTAPGTFDFANPTRPDGRTLHGDHASVSYQIPLCAKGAPMVFLHGAGQSSRCWDTTPDGREGWRTWFLRAGYPVYLMDQPRRGQAGRATVTEQPSPVPDDQLWLENFRIHAGAFPEGETAMEQFLRWMTPNTGPFDAALIADALGALAERIGPNILFTHSQGGVPGWLVPARAPLKAIVAIEPGAFCFPESAVPAPIPNSSPFTPITPVLLSEADFDALCRTPILVVFGDGIATEPDAVNWPADGWRARVEQGRQFVAAVNARGGDASLLLLPEVGLKGNTHFPFADTNSAAVAEAIRDWLRSRGL